MNELIYFAYGSNMLTQRLVERVGEVQCLGIACLENYALKFNKSGADSSGKCNIIAEKGNVVWGVLFAMNHEQKAILDVFEGVGHGYQAISIDVKQDNKIRKVFAYEALKQALLDDDNQQVKPFTWYKNFVYYGAKEHHLPDTYQSMLFNVDADDDKDKERDTVNKNVLIKSGINI